MVEGKMIMIEGGNVDFGKEWFKCRKCHKLIDGIENHTPCKKCVNYNKEELEPVNI
jgi:hypothetical protein